MKHSRHGFTLIEVMVSLGVMTVGAMAIMALQQQTTRANVHAREITTATQIAQTWIERLKLDAIRWRSVGGPPATDLVNTMYLVEITTAGAAGTFRTFRAPPVGVTTTNSAAFDFLGNDVAVNGAVRYCASHRLSWIYTGSLIRADVRVWWPRDALGNASKSTANSILGDFAACADDNAKLNPGGTEIDNYHVVYLSTAIRPML